MSMVLVALLVSNLSQSTAKEGPNLFYLLSKCIAITSSDNSESMKVTISGRSPRMVSQNP
jgi:hypothetical protein